MHVCMCAMLLFVASCLQEVPICDLCLAKGDPGTAEVGIVKPDIVFFGEGLSNEFHHQIHSDKGKVCDIVSGSHFLLSNVCTWYGILTLLVYLKHCPTSTILPQYGVCN